MQHELPYVCAIFVCKYIGLRVYVSPCVDINAHMHACLATAPHSPIDRILANQFAASGMQFLEDVSQSDDGGTFKRC